MHDSPYTFTAYVTLQKESTLTSILVFFLFSIKEFSRVIIEKSFREARRSELPFSSLENFSILVFAIQKLDNGDFVRENGRSTFVFSFLYAGYIQNRTARSNENVNCDGLIAWSAENTTDTTNLQSRRKETKNS